MISLTQKVVFTRFNAAFSLAVRTASGLMSIPVMLAPGHKWDKEMLMQPLPQPMSSRFWPETKNHAPNLPVLLFPGGELEWNGLA